jgi:methyl-accepting chemotaxis protein
MPRRTFGTKLAGGFALTLTLTLIMAVTSVTALTIVVNSNNQVVTAATESLLGTQRLHTAMESRGSSARGYLITGTPAGLSQAQQDRALFLSEAGRLRDTLTDPRARDLLDDVTAAEAQHAALLTPQLEKRSSLRDLTQVSQLLTDEVLAARHTVDTAIAALTDRVRTLMDIDRAHATRRAAQAIITVIVLSVTALACGATIAWRLSRSLRKQIGAAVGHIRSSVTQLQATAAQQVTSGQHQATAIREITTTTSDLLIASRQIADSAQRVCTFAEQTEAAARAGDATIEQTRASMTTIRGQVDQIAQHMLALGEKSQQIGGVVDLVTELAEQTNILAVNATIEATSAGQWGRRFAVVAEEIRKLADRTAESATNIRTLINDVRGSVTTTMAATRSGTEAADAGIRQFDDATTSFRTIVELAATTNTASHDIELSTQQQSTAVEQVTITARDTAQLSRETEAGAIQTKQTAAHLATLSSGLLQLVGTGRARQRTTHSH